MTMLVSELRPDSCVVAEVRPSPNHSERRNGIFPDMIVLHYTGTRDNESAIRQLCNPYSEVSAHYVVLQDGHIVQLVAESRRAWHAGVSSWAGETDINSCSIGIEVANPGHDHGYSEFPRRQVAAVNLLRRNLYIELAGRRNVTAQVVGIATGCQLLRQLSAGEAYLLADGKWRRWAPGQPPPVPENCG